MLSKWKPIKKGLSESKIKSKSKSNSKSERMPLKKLMKIDKNNSTLWTTQTFVSISFCDDANKCFYCCRFCLFCFNVAATFHEELFSPFPNRALFSLIYGFLPEDVDGNLLHKRCHSNIIPFLTQQH